MTTAIRLPFALALTLAVAPLALAELEGPDAHAHGATRTITLDGRDVRPSTTQMDHGDIVSFVNYSTRALHVTFIEPKDMEKRVRCGLLHDAKVKSAPPAPWALFTWDDGKLAANVPPGQFASVCSFEPGSYSFTVESLGAAAGRSSDRTGVLPAKGNLEVK